MFLLITWLLGIEPVEELFDIKNPEPVKDSTLFTSNYSNGKLKFKFNVDKAQRKHGPAYTYFPEGAIKSEITYNHGVKQHALQYHRNGNKAMEFFYLNGQKHGIRTKFWEDGSVQSKLEYSRDKPANNLIEFNKKGKKLEKYPTLKIHTIDRLQETGEYIIEVYFDENPS